jgi:hypothetical protein
MRVYNGNAVQLALDAIQHIVTTAMRWLRERSQGEDGMLKRKVRHVYHVLVTSYATEEIKERVERGEVFITQPEQLSIERFYLGNGEAQAERVV